MKVAFVGVKRRYLDLPVDYRQYFTRYHLELPFYYARDGFNDVTVTTVDYKDDGSWLTPPDNEVTRKATAPLGFLRYVTEVEFQRNRTTRYEVVVHWRKWFREFYRPEAINVLNCQDHSFSGEWVAAVTNAVREKKLRGILCFPHWHAANILLETGLPAQALIVGLTLGVDTDIYKPSPKKDFHQMLWASDPGRGLFRALQLQQELFRRDQRYRLHVCYPDYVSPQMQVRVPGVVWHSNMKNGPELWNLFNECGILPYTSVFKEPSSRAHRQAQAAGCLVLYPPGMGTPSDLIQENGGGVVAPVEQWASLIPLLVETSAGSRIGVITDRAREVAVSENWAVQAKRFNEFFERELQCR